MLSWFDPYLAWGLHVKLRFPGNSSKLIQSQFSLIIFCDNIRHVGSTKSNVDRAPRAHTAHGTRNVLNKLCNHALSGKKQFSANRVPVCMVRFLLWSHFKRTSDSSQLIKPFSSSKKSHFQNEVKRKTFLVKMSFICMRIDLIHDTCHLFTRSTDGMKEKSRGFSRT